MRTATHALAPLCLSLCSWWSAVAWSQVPTPPTASSPVVTSTPASDSTDTISSPGDAFSAPTFSAPGGPPVLGAAGRPSSAFLPGALGFPFNAAAPQPGASGRAYNIQPSLAGQVLGTDNVRQSTNNARSDLVTTLTPGLLVSIDTARLQGILNYAPSIQIFASDSSQTRILQNGSGQFIATLVPDAVFLDVRGAAATQSASGGFAPQSSPTIDRQGLVQTTSFQISPYILRRFGDLATAQLGYGYQSVRQELGGNASGAFTPTGQQFFTDNHFVAHAFYALARTGPSFGRLALDGRVISTEYEGTGVLQNAHRRVAAVEARYAVTRQVSLLAEVGYEMQRYSGNPRFVLSEPIWALGTRLTLSDESSVTLKYVRRNGFESPSVAAAIALGGRTRLFANYSEQLSTGAQRAADLLTTTTLDALGNPVDSRSGEPIAPSIGDSFQGTQSSLQRVRRASVTLSQTWPRDVVSLTALSEQRRPIAVAAGTVGIEQRATSISVAWSHSLTPTTTSIATMQYGRLERSGFGSSDIYGATAALVTQLTPGLSAFLQYGLTNRGDQFAPGRAIQNVLLIGMRQNF